jgi:excinuclease ABC subunit C
LLKETSINEHESHISQARNFLAGKSSTLISDLENDMLVRAKNLEFEKAQEIKETIDALRFLHERQKVRDILEGDVDIFLLYEKYEKKFIALTQIRSSQIVGVFRHEIALGADDTESIAVSFLMRQYLDNEDIPDLLLL